MENVYFVEFSLVRIIFSQSPMQFLLPNHVNSTLVLSFLSLVHKFEL